MALDKDGVMDAFLTLYTSTLNDIVWDDLEYPRQQIALLLQILAAVDSSFSPGGSGAVETPTLGLASGPVSTSVPAGSIEISIAVTAGSGSIDGVPVVVNQTFLWRASPGKTLDTLAYTIDPGGTFLILTVDPN